MQWVAIVRLLWIHSIWFHSFQTVNNQINKRLKTHFNVLKESNRPLCISGLCYCYYKGYDYDTFHYLVKDECKVSNSSRPRHRALIEGVIFRKCINTVYVIFFSYRERWYVMSKNFWKSVCVYTYKKGFPFKRLWDYKNTFFCQRKFYYR